MRGHETMETGGKEGSNLWMERVYLEPYSVDRKRPTPNTPRINALKTYKIMELASVEDYLQKNRNPIDI